MVLRSILLRKGIRSDRIWTNRFFLKKPLWKIPIFLDTQALLRSQYWPREKLTQLSQERFAETVRHAATIPFWKERFANVGINPHTFSERDIARIPLLSKKDFNDRDAVDYTVPALLATSQKYYTSGSTGNPFSIYRDQQFELRAVGVSERMFRALGEGKQFPVVFATRVPLMREFALAKYHFFYLLSYNSVRHRIHKLQKLISEFQNGVILFGRGSTLLEIARVCKELRLSPRIRGLISSGEELRESQRKEIEDIFHVPIRISYGSSETRQIAFECAQHRIHLNEECSYFEITDDKGAPLPLGSKGRIVVTGFENRVMPFIRRDTGDIGTMSEDPCPCGRTLRTVIFHGREVHFLHVGDGRTVTLMDFIFVLDAYYNEIRQFQIIRTGECAFTLCIVPRNTFDENSMKSEITERLAFRIHPNIHINWEIVDSIPEGPNGKAQYFIDEFEKKI